MESFLFLWASHLIGLNEEVEIQFGGKARFLSVRRLSVAFQANLVTIKPCLLSICSLLPSKICSNVHLVFFFLS